MDTNVLSSEMDAQLLESYDTCRTAGKLFMRYWDDSVLSEVCVPVMSEQFGKDLDEFSDLFLKTLASHGNGLGLAANQVGLALRLCAIKLKDETVPPFVMVNPVIKWSSEEQEAGQEGCLSVPTIYDQVWRAKSIQVEFDNVSGKSRTLDLTGLDARVVQHEIDHLNGKMFFDRMPKNPRKAVLRKWEKIRHKYE